MTQACKKRTLDGMNINIHKIPISTSILVSGTSESTTQETVELYFDNKKRCGADGVERVEYIEDEGFRVFYEDHTGKYM